MSSTGLDIHKAGLVDQFTASKMWGALNKLHQKGGGDAKSPVVEGRFPKVKVEQLQSMD